jgi:hypothetical protein
MAKKKHTTKKKPVYRSKGSAYASGGKVRVKGHTRNPRGPDAGKKPVRVIGYRRRVGKRPRPR